MRITPIRHPLDATVRVPGSKSMTNRVLIVAALANGRTKLTNALFSDDTLYLAKALQNLGFDVGLDEANREITVHGLGGKIPATKADLFIGNAGTAARFLTAFLTLGNGEYIIDGDSRMRERPIDGLIDTLTQLGAKLEASNHRLPVRIRASGLPGGKASIAGDVSSQFSSAVLMSAPYAQTPVEITLNTELNSKPYVDLTLSVMNDFGVEVKRDGYCSFSVPVIAYRLPRSESFDQYLIESDATSASYFFAAAAVCGGTVRVENISRKSKQGDVAFLDILARMGCVVEESDSSIAVTRRSGLKGIDADMRDIPDTAQTLAAIAPFADSPTRIRGIASARFKETDRIHAVCVELGRLGVRVEEHEDGLTIHPLGTMRPAVIRTYNDHRMAMAFPLIGLRVEGIVIENPACVSKTFPGFFDALNLLR